MSFERHLVTRGMARPGLAVGGTENSANSRATSDPVAGKDRGAGRRRPGMLGRATVRSHLATDGTGHGPVTGSAAPSVGAEALRDSWVFDTSQKGRRIL
ncbi:hypothetical protein GCM10022254_50740 [Actinomadura meridiana]|uniref:Uncharacterized protein n=1 Tax=Actinomadura meridiana TaxID=559626 RepID=A0ABP8CCU3_9ACTN